VHGHIASIRVQIRQQYTSLSEILVTDRKAVSIQNCIDERLLLGAQLTCCAQQKSTLHVAVEPRCRLQGMAILPLVQLVATLWQQQQPWR